MGEFKYLSGVIPMVLAEFLIIFIITLFFYNRQRIELNKLNLIKKSLYEAFFYGQPFEYVYRSHLGTIQWNCCLLFTRLASLVFFLSVGCIWNYIQEDGFNYRYFTQWNIDWICVYFLLATFASVIGIINDFNLTKISSSVGESSFSKWSEWISVVSNATQVIFVVTGASAMFVTVVNFGLLNSQFKFWNVSNHFVTSLAILLELSLNSIPVRREHVVFNVAWALTYLLFIWPAVTLNTVREWPYDFLKTNAASSYVWYSILVVINVVFYFLWYGIFLLKERYLVTRPSPPETSSSYQDDTTSGVEVVTHVSPHREGRLLLDKDVEAQGPTLGGKAAGDGGSYAAVHGPMRTDNEIEIHGL